MTLAPELVLADRYRLVERIAVGGMGEVWRAVDTILGRQVAVKALRAELADDPEFLFRFRAEARHTASLLHPGIANVYDYGEVGDGQGRSGAQTAYLVMELVDGEPLSAILARHGRLDPALTLDICAQAALALQAAHEAGVVHRDVKPGNLLVRADGVVKVTDFGIARAADAAPTTAAGTLMGTAYYLSPEQASGEPVGPASDVYSLGVVAFECLSGRRPFRGDNAVAVALAHQREPVPDLPPQLPVQVRRVVLQALEKDPADRPRSAGELARDLQDVSRQVYGDSAAGPTVVLPAAVARAVGPDATRPLPATNSPLVQPPGSAPTPPSRPAAPPRAPARRAAPLILGVVLALVVAAALLVRTLGGGDPVEQPEVPAVEGQLLAAATAQLEEAGLRVDVRRTPTRAAEPDTVLSQDPGAGERAEDGTVMLEVAEQPSGPQTVEVDPEVYRGRDYEEVEADLSDLGLRVRRTNTGSGGTPGTVGDVDPSGDVEVDSVVTVFVVPEPLAPGAASSSPSARASSTPRASAAPTPRGDQSASTGSGSTGSRDARPAQNNPGRTSGQGEDESGGQEQGQGEQQEGGRR